MPAAYTICIEAREYLKRVNFAGIPIEFPAGICDCLQRLQITDFNTLGNGDRKERSTVNVGLANNF